MGYFGAWPSGYGKAARFSNRLRGLRDGAARARIVARIQRLALGSMGDARPVGGGVSESRVHHGPGYRVHLARRGAALVVLLCGGDGSTQDCDTAKAVAWQMEERGADAAGDPASHLDSVEAVGACPNEVLASGDAAFVAGALGVVARARGMAGVAERAGLSRESLYRSLSAGGDPEFATVLRAFGGLGLRVQAARRRRPDARTRAKTPRPAGDAGSPAAKAVEDRRGRGVGDCAGRPGRRAFRVVGTATVGRARGSAAVGVATKCGEARPKRVPRSRPARLRRRKGREEGASPPSPERPSTASGASSPATAP